jgi:pilus assembly protein FimV
VVCENDKKIRKATLEYRAKSIGVAALLLCVSIASEALTLGDIRGPVIIGRPLDVTIPVQVEKTDDAAASCFGAEVFHADVRQPAARVRVLVEPTGTAQSFHVRVLSSALVNEPVVSVTLRTRCDLKTERRYVLLADLPKGVDLSLPIQVGVIFPAPTSTAASQPTIANSAPLSMAAEASLVKPRRAVRASAESAEKAVRKPSAKNDDRAAKRKGVPSAQSRLQLDSLELFSDRISSLDMEQPDAAADFVSPDQQKVQDMQGTVESLQALVAKNEASQLELRARLNQAETERFPAWLVYILSGLILAAVAAIAVLWGRQRRAQAQDGEWWSASVVAQDGEAAPPVGPSRSMPLAPVPMVKRTVEPRLEKGVTAPLASQWPHSKTHGVQVSEVEMGESRFNRYMQSGEVHDDPEVSPLAAPLDLVQPESERLDAVLVAELRQQADFFVALGQTDQAVVILEKLIHDGDVPDPHVYLDLLGLLHSLSKKVEFQRSRDAFNRAFNGVVPEFVRFKSEGRALEAYPAVLADVVAHWAISEALDCINAYVVRPQSESSGTSLDLAAFRDLLLLQAISQQLKAEELDHLSEPSVHQSRMTPSFDPLDVDLGEPDFASMMELDLDLSDGDAESVSGPEGSTGGGGPATTPTGLKVDDLTPSQADNLIDFDLPDVVMPKDPDGKS